MSNSPNLFMPLWSEGQEGADIVHNEALLIIDILLQGRIKDRDLTSDPASPAEGDAYIVASVASGLWTGQEDNIAYFFGGIWNFITPKEGWRLFVIDELVDIKFTSGAWTTSGTGAQVKLIGEVSAAGAIVTSFSTTGASFTVANSATGVWDITLLGILGVVFIAGNINDRTAGGYLNRTVDHMFGPVTTKGSDLTSRGDNTGFRVLTIQGNQADACGGCFNISGQERDYDFSFTVLGE